MIGCRSAYIGDDKPYLQYYTTAQECVDALKRRESFNFWTLPDSELIKLAKHYEKIICKDDRANFTLEKLRKAKDDAIEQHLRSFDIPTPKCLFEVDIDGITKKCTLLENHKERHSYK